MSDRPALWGLPIPIICLAGEVASGKTLFGLTCTDPRTIKVWDEEGSSAAYQPSLGFTRVSMTHELQKRHPKGFQPIHAFEFFRDDLLRTPKGQFRVGMIDTVAMIDLGLTDWVESNPDHFGRSKSQYESMSAMKWGDVDETWKLILSECEARFETVIFTAHLKDVWGTDKKPTGRKRPGWKKSFDQRATLILQLERKADAKGVRPDKPSAIVLKDRLCHLRFDPATGETAIQAVLPPRLDVATPQRIREYIDKPANFDKLKPSERMQEEVLTEDERLILKTRAAEADAEARRLEMEKLNRIDGMRKAPPPPAPTTAAPKQEDAPVTDQQRGGGGEAPAPKTEPPAPPPSPASGQQQPSAPVKLTKDHPLAKELSDARVHLFAARSMVDETERKALWAEKLKPFGVTSAYDLTIAQTEVLLADLKKLVPF